MPDCADPACHTLLSRYLAACMARDVAAITACFAPRAVVIDPTAPHVRGRAAIGRYFAALYGDLAELRLETSPIYWQGATAACHWRGQARRLDGKAISYEGVDLFDFSQGGAQGPLIARMRAFWDPSDFQ
jgi:ketosteroid isomerase-like protein